MGKLAKVRDIVNDLKRMQYAASRYDIKGSTPLVDYHGVMRLANKLSSFGTSFIDIILINMIVFPQLDKLASKLTKCQYVNTTDLLEFARFYVATRDTIEPLPGERKLECSVGSNTLAYDTSQRCYFSIRATGNHAIRCVYTDSSCIHNQVYITLEQNNREKTRKFELFSTTTITDPVLSFRECASILYSTMMQYVIYYMISAYQTTFEPEVNDDANEAAVLDTTD